jgi:hypothetical protein
MKVCRLYLAKPLLIFYLFMFAAFVIAGVVGIIVAALGMFGSGGPPAWVFIIVLVFGLFNAYMWLRIPFEIKILDDATIEFRSLLRNRTVSPAEIKSVRAKRYGIGFVDVAYGTGTIHLLSQMDGFHEFVSTIKAANPDARIEGC